MEGSGIERHGAGLELASKPAAQRRHGGLRGHGNHLGAQSSQLTGAKPAICVEEDHVAPGDRAERLERAREFPLEVHAGLEAAPQ